MSNARVQPEEALSRLVPGLWQLGDPQATESGLISLPLLHSSIDEPIYVWTLTKDEFTATDPENLGRQVPLALKQQYGIDQLQLAKAIQREQLAIKKPWRRITDEGRKRQEVKASYFDENGKFVSKRLADGLLEIYQFRTTTDTKEIYIYDSGVWQPKGESLVHAECQRRLGEQTTAHYISEVQNYIRGETYIEREVLSPDVNLLNFENGVYNIETGELSPHNPRYLFTHKLPVVYDPDAKCPEVEKFLEEVQPDQVHRQGMIELAGYCLHRKYPFHRAWMLVGNGANGKSTYINLTKAFLGSTNIVSVSLHEFEDNRFSKASLYDKHANLYPDLPSRALYQTGVFKMTTGGDPLTGEKKFRDPFNFVNYAKMIFSANQVPRVSDDTDAFYRRWIIINFPNKFEGEAADPRIIEKLTTPGELSGLLNLALKALKELLARGQFANDKQTEIKREQYVRLSDPVKSFIMDRIDAAPEDFVTKEELYQIFSEYCRANNYPTIAKETFHKHFRKEAPVQDYRPRIGDQRVVTWKGIRLRSDEDIAEDGQARLG